MTVTLSSAEILTAAIAGVYRKLQSIRKGHNASAVRPDMRWDAEIEGALAECAFSKAFGLYWGASEGTYKDADVGFNIQVRHTIRPDGCLIIRPKDISDPYYYVLVVGSVPNYRIAGYIHGSTKPKPTWRRNPGGAGEALFIPQSDLLPVEDFFTGGIQQ